MPEMQTLDPIGAVMGGVREGQEMKGRQLQNQRREQMLMNDQQRSVILQNEIADTQKKKQEAEEFSNEYIESLADIEAEPGTPEFRKAAMEKYLTLGAQKGDVELIKQGIEFDQALKKGDIEAEKLAGQIELAAERTRKARAEADKAESEASGGGTSIEYGTSVNKGINPETGKEQEYLVGKDGSIKWLPTGQKKEQETSSYSQVSFDSSLAADVFNDPKVTGLYGNVITDTANAIKSNVGLPINRDRTQYANKATSIRSEVQEGLRSVGIRAKDHIEMIMKTIPDPNSVTMGGESVAVSLMQAREEIDRIIGEKQEMINSGSVSSSDESKLTQSLIKLKSIANEVAPPIPSTQEHLDSIPDDYKVFQIENMPASAVVRMVENLKRNGAKAPDPNSKYGKALFNKLNEIRQKGGS